MQTITQPAKKPQNSKSNQTVMEAVWPWRKPDLEFRKGSRRRKIRSLVMFGVVFCVASLLVFIMNHLWFGVVLYSLSGLILAGGFFVPPVYYLFDWLGQRLTYIVGTSTTYLLLVPFYYLCVLPRRLLLMLSGKDPMQRRWETDSDSYWADRQSPENIDNYKRQY